MIQKLNLHDVKVVEDVLEVQLLAYQVEAEIIDFDGIPQLKDTVSSIMDCGETFIGYKTEDRLAGFISYTIENNIMDICRLVVHPDYFRKGIASSLMEYVMNKYAKLEKFIVSTGEKNTPAIALYERFGFKVVQKQEVAEDVYIVLMEKK